MKEEIKRSGELNFLALKLEKLISAYQRRKEPFRGGHQIGYGQPTKEPLFSGYTWEQGGRSVLLRESEMTHGADVLKVLVQRSLTSQDDYMGVVSYEKGNGVLEAYIILPQNKEPSDNFKLPTNLEKTSDSIYLEQFIAAIYLSRGTKKLPVKEDSFDLKNSPNHV